MQVTRFAAALPYEAPNHHGVASLLLQGRDATRVGAFWCGLSHVLPAGGASRGAAPHERVYVVLDGEIAVATAREETVLRTFDSCCIEAHEERTLENRTNRPATLLVVMAAGGGAR
ncbi:MAG: cupin domain-containing protein [Burkholderiales bacterium]